MKPDKYWPPGYTPSLLDELVTDCERCGFPLDSFACKIRHVQMNTGDAKAAND